MCVCEREREYGNHVLLKYGDDSHYSALAKAAVILLLQDVLFVVVSFSLNLSFPAQLLSSSSKRSTKSFAHISALKTSM